MKVLAGLVLGFFSACWLLFLLHVVGLFPLRGNLPIGLYLLYSAASALGWAAGTVYVQLTRTPSSSPRWRLFLLCILAPPGLLFLLRSMAPAAAQSAAPLVPLYALCVFGILFAVPVSFRNVGRR